METWLRHQHTHNSTLLTAAFVLLISHAQNRIQISFHAATTQSTTTVTKIAIKPVKTTQELLLYCFNYIFQPKGHHETERNLVMAF